jgi:hypothetical protein
MPANSFSTGRDCQLVVIGPSGANGQPGTRVDLEHVIGFESRQLTHPIRIDRLDGVHIAAELPKGWEGHFELERGSSAADDFIDSLEQAWFNDGLLEGGTLYQYVTEVDGSVSTYQFDGAVFKMASAGQWKGDASVRQRLDFFASRRQRVS